MRQHRDTGVDGIWALGVCNGRGGFTHTSYNDYEIVAANLLGGDTRRVSDRIPAYALFIDPPLGRAGLTETQVRESERKALMATRPMTRVGRAKEKGETQAFMKILVDAGIAPPSCERVPHRLLWFLNTRLPLVDRPGKGWRGSTDTRPVGGTNDW